jgi:glycosyltransferase involved in cell wall biosynthesis
MRILLFHQYYLMPGQAGGSRFNEMARFWTEAGHDVDVIAGTVDYANGVMPEAYRGRWVLKEDDKGVTVWRCHVPETYGTSYIGRMWAFLAFMFSAATAVLRTARPDVIVATSPPLIIAFPAIFAARLRWRRIPWVFEVRDLWPESAVTTGILSRKSPLTRLLYAVERWAYRFADQINVLTPAFEQDIVRRGLASASKVSFISNGADLDRFSPGPIDNDVRREFGWGDRFVMLYAGAHGRANAVGQLVAAAELLRDRPDILIATVGDGNERAAAEAEAKKRNLGNIVFLGSQPKERMADFVKAANAGAAVLQDNPTFRTVYPNKVFDYMACARPTLLAIDGIARTLVCHQAQAGVFVEPENASSIAEGICLLADNPGLCSELGVRGRAWVEANASRRALANRYLDLLTELNSTPGVPVPAHPHA